MSGDETRSGVESEAPEPTNGEAGPAPAVETHDAETLRRIVALNRNVTAARDRFDAADRARKVAKEELEEEQAILNRFIAGLDEDLPLFDRGEGEEPAADGWRSVHLNSLVDADGDPLPHGVFRALAENEPPLLTMGDVADWSKAGHRLTDVKGIGDAKAEDIDAVLEHFWNGRAVDDPVNAEIVAGVREAEAGKGSSVPQDAPSGAPSWRDVTVGDLGLSEATVAILDRQVISTVGELVAIARMGAGWMGQAAQIDVDEALSRFRNRRSNADIEEFDAARDGEAPAARPRVRGRRAAGATS